MKRLPFRRGAVLALTLAVLAATAMALWLGVFGQERAAASPGVDLVITKTASPTEATPVAAGDTITYTLTATNEGATTATDVLIRDYIGDGLTFVSATGGDGVTCVDVTPADGIDCTVASLATGVSATVTIVATVSATSGFVYNGAYVDPDNTESGEDNEDADDPDLDCTASGGDVGEGADDGDGPTEADNYDCTRHGMVDLTITKATSPSEGTAVGQGSQIVYTLTVSNDAAATGTATNVVIRDYIGDGLTFVSATPGDGVSCTDIVPPIDCTVASLAPGQSGAVAILVTVAATSGTVYNGARVDPLAAITETNEDADDPALACAAVGEGAAGAAEPDNYDCTRHTVTALPNLTITKTASPSETTVVDTGDTITYTLTVTNGGAATATSVDIQDTIGSGLSLSSVTQGDGVTCADTTAPEINCVAASIASGQSRTVTIVVSVSATSGTVLNGAEVDPDDDITETNEDADDPTRDCGAVGEGTDAASATEPDNYDCARHSFAEVTPTPTPSQLLNCPFSGKWAISVWDGPSGTATADALATCTNVTIDAAYSLDRTTNQWSHYFPGRSDINNLLTLNDMQAIIVLGR